MDPRDTVVAYTDGVRQAVAHFLNTVVGQDIFKQAVYEASFAASEAFLKQEASMRVKRRTAESPSPDGKALRAGPPSVESKS